MLRSRVIVGAASMRSTIATAGLLSVLSLVSGCASSTIRTRKVQIIDSSGQVRMTLDADDSPLVRLFDEHGKTRMLLTDEGVALLDTTGQLRASLAMVEYDGSTFAEIMLWGPSDDSCTQAAMRTGETDPQLGLSQLALCRPPEARGVTLNVIDGKIVDLGQPEVLKSQKIIYDMGLGKVPVPGKSVLIQGPPRN